MIRVLLVATLLLSAAHADGGQAVPYTGRTVANVIEGFLDQGYHFAYSTNLVSDDLRVLTEPEPGTRARDRAPDPQALRPGSSR